MREDGEPRPVDSCPPWTTFAKPYIPSILRENVNSRSATTPAARGAGRHGRPRHDLVGVEPVRS